MHLRISIHIQTLLGCLFSLLIGTALTAQAAPKAKSQNTRITKKTLKQDAVSQHSPVTGSFKAIRSLRSSGSSARKLLETTPAGKKEIQRVLTGVLLPNVGPKQTLTVRRVQPVQSRETRGKLTRVLHGWKAKSPRLSKSIELIRKYSIVGLLGYSTKVVKEDPKFLGGYMVSNVLVTNVGAPIWVAAGLNPVVAAVTYVLSTPLTAFVLVWRKYSLLKQAGKNVSFLSAAKMIQHEYDRFSTERLEHLDAQANQIETRERK